jgi:hypothetical protein
MPKKKELDHELQEALKDIVKKCETEDEFVRRAQIRTWKKNEEFWHGVQYLFWNEKGQTWISPMSGAAPNLGFSEEENTELGPFYDFVIDIFSAHGQSIISALSNQVPSVKFLPDDGSDDEDVDTAKTYDKISELVARHNNAKLKFIQTLFFLYINGIVFSYRYIDTDKKYGVYRVPVFKNQDVTTLICPECNADLGATNEGEVDESPENIEENEESKIDEHTSDEEFEGDKETGEKEDSTKESSGIKKIICPECQQEIIPEEQKNTIPLYVRDEDKPKSRVKHEIYGPLFVKVPCYAFDQEGFGYLGLYLDKPKDELVAALCYEEGKLDEDLARKIESEWMINDDRWARTEWQYPTGPEQENKAMTTLIQYWLRPSKFNLHEDYKIRERLLKEFPKGCKIILVGKTKVFISAVEEELDKRWTVGKAGLSTYIHSDPLCRPLVPIQEMRNQLDNLVMDTIEHGIPSTFADSEVLDFDAYGRFEALPGYMFKAKSRPGKTLGESFYTEQKAQVPREVGAFRAALDKDAQFTVGSFPSLYGGPSEGKSRTLGEYQQSRQQALQRLAITWCFVADFYRRDMDEMVRMFAEMMIEDEHFTRVENGNYITVWIRKSQMQGKIGGVESEASDQFPASIQTIQAFLTKFIELNNPQINAALYAPENRRVLQDYYMLNKLKIPGTNQIYKQTCEINEMMKGNGPIAPGIPSVPIEPAVDDDAIHIAACKDFLVNDIGLDLKKQQPLIYADVLAHMMQHQQNLQLKTLTQFEGTPPGQQPDTSETSSAGGDE